LGRWCGVGCTAGVFCCALGGFGWHLYGSATHSVFADAMGLDLAKAFAKFGMTDFKWFGALVLVVTGVILGYHFGRYKKTLRTFLVLGMMCVASLVPVLGHLHNWYLYIPSAFFCLIVAGIFLHHSSRIFYTVFACLCIYYAGVLTREALFWRDASVLSEQFVSDVLPYAKTTQGRLFVVNTPSAWTPKSSLSGKPLFAFALRNAVAMRSPTDVTAEIIMVNHIWLTDEHVQCEVKRQGPLLDLEISNGGYFSFHGNGEGQTPPFGLDFEWGKMQVLSERRIQVELSLLETDRVVYFDGKGVRSF